MAEDDVFATVSNTTVGSNGSLNYTGDESQVSNIIQIQSFYEVDTSLYRPKRCISIEDVVRGRYTTGID